MNIEGNRLKWTGSITSDENTGNPIENHVFEGYVGWNQIYAVEEYEEIFPDGRREMLGVFSPESFLACFGRIKKCLPKEVRKFWEDGLGSAGGHPKGNPHLS